jgi:hypothetical protein
MASNATPPPAPNSCATGGCCTGQTLAYLLIRVVLGVMLIMAGVDKFKSSEAPYSYSVNNWYNEYNEDGEKVKDGKWLNISKPVYEFGGFNNAALWTERGANFLSHAFKAYAYALPWAMIFVGFFIFIGFMNRISLLLGGGIWFSLAFGQMCLPDNQYVSLLINYTFFYIIALALVKYNRCAVTRF